MRHLKRIAKYFAFALLSILIILLASIPLARFLQPGDLLAVDNDRPLAIDNVNLVTMSDTGVLRDRQLRIRDGRIEAIGNAGDVVSDDYRLIDAGGAWLAPGLIDMHVHAMDRKYLGLSLAYGVTSVRNLGGYPMHLRWREELAQGEWLGSNLFSASPTMNGERNANPLAHKVFTDPELARAAVRRYHEQGWDLVKVYARLDPDVFAAIIDEAQQLDLPVAGHMPYSVVELNYELAGALATMEHTEDIFQGPLAYEYDDARVQEIAAFLEEHEVTVTPTLMIFDHLTEMARGKQGFVDTLELEYLNPLMRAFESRTSVSRWLGADERLTASLEKRNEYFAYITRVLYDTGVDLVLGSDCGVIYAAPGISTHEEIRLLAATGIPAEAILRMATIDAAAALRADDWLGSIEAGKFADLVLTRGNPLEDLGTLAAPLAVAKDGQWLDRDDLAALRESARNPSGLYLTMGRMLEFVLFG